MRGETEFALFEAGDHQHFGNMAVAQDRVRRKVLRHFAEAGAERGFPASAADAGFRVAHDARRAIDDARFGQRPDRQVGGGRIAAGIRHQARVRYAFAAEFRQPVNRFGQQRRLRVRGFVPMRVVLHRAQAKRPAQIHHARSGREHGRRQLHRNFRRRGQKHDFDFLRAHGLGRRRHLPRTFRMAQPALVRRVAAMLHQQRLDVRVLPEERDQLRPAVPAKSDNPGPMLHD